MAKGTKTTTRTVHRDSGSGEFITRKEADKRPKETQKETIKVPKKKP